MPLDLVHWPSALRGRDTAPGNFHVGRPCLHLIGSRFHQSDFPFGAREETSTLSSQLSSISGSVSKRCMLIPTMPVCSPVDKNNVAGSCAPHRPFSSRENSFSLLRRMIHPVRYRPTHTGPRYAPRIVWSWPLPIHLAPRISPIQNAQDRPPQSSLPGQSVRTPAAQKGR